MRVGMIGLGKLGLPVAEAMARTHDVMGTDIRPVTTERVKLGTLAEVAAHSEILFIAVPTPHDPAYDGSAPTSHLPSKDFDYSTVIAVLQQLEHCDIENTTVVLISTVLPGTLRRQLARHISKTNLVYNPYLIAMGTVAHDMVHPEMILIGTATGTEDAAVEQLRAFYAPMMQNDPRVITGTWEEMEAIKIFYNTFISAKIGLVNMIQDVAERVGNMDSDLVARALADSTQRIMGPAYMKPGMGDGGPCHPRDNIALRWLAQRLDLGYDLFDGIMRAREVQADNLARELVSHNLPVVILGKSYKQGVDHTDGSYSLLVGHCCESRGAVVSYDAISLAPAVYLLAHQRYYTTEMEQIAQGSVVVDPWRSTTVPDGIELIPYGNTRSIT